MLRPVSGIILSDSLNIISPRARWVRPMARGHRHTTQRVAPASESLRPGARRSPLNQAAWPAAAAPGGGRGGDLGSRDSLKQGP